MLLTIDLGNTCIKYGIFNNDEAVAFTMIDTEQKDYRPALESFIYKSGLRLNQITHVIMSSVVPKIRNILYEIVVEDFGVEPIEINNEHNYGINIAVENPKEVGSDLLVMCAYAHYLYHRDTIVCSMGTCSAMCYIDELGNFKYCVLAPGFKKMAETFINGAALLPNIELEKKHTFLVANTLDAMNVGLYDGYIGMIEYLIKNITKELDRQVYVVACGGSSSEIVKYTDIFNIYEPDFVTFGLNFIYNRYYHE